MLALVCLGGPYAYALLGDDMDLVCDGRPWRRVGANWECIDEPGVVAVPMGGFFATIPVLVLIAILFILVPSRPVSPDMPRRLYVDDGVV